MGRRSEPRIQIAIPVRIFGTDSAGQVFSENVHTVDVSRNGVSLSGVRAKLSIDDIVGLTVAGNRVHFRVKWIGLPGTPSAGRVGLLNIAPAKPLWNFDLPAPDPDDFHVEIPEQRRTPRFLCQNSVELHTPEGASFWGTLSDLSLGGCYVEMAAPLDVGTKVKLGLWLDQSKIWAHARISHRTPGLGFGLQFIDISTADLEQIRRFLNSLADLARQPLREDSSESIDSF
jgi:hypothetical protein